MCCVADFILFTHDGGETSCLFVSLLNTKTKPNSASLNAEYKPLGLSSLRWGSLCILNLTFSGLHNESMELQINIFSPLTVRLVCLCRALYELICSPWSSISGWTERSWLVWQRGKKNPSWSCQPTFCKHALLVFVGFKDQVAVIK